MKCASNLPLIHSQVLLNGFVGLALIATSGVSIADVKGSKTADSKAEKMAIQTTSLSAQDKLDAIRQGLVEAALETPTRVQTTTWIDANGSLRESSSFKNGMKVRGVKVLAYDRDEAGQPTAQLELPEKHTQQTEEDKKNLSTAWAKLKTLFASGVTKLSQHLVSGNETTNTPADTTAMPSGQCEAARVGVDLKHLIHFEMAMDRDVHPSFVQTLTPLLQKNWLSSGPVGVKTNWKMLQSSAHTPTMASTRTAYETALLSSSVGNVPWVARIISRTDLLPSPGLGGLRGELGPALVATLTLEIIAKEDVNLSYQESVKLPLEVETQAWRPARISLASEQAINRQIQVWSKTLTHWLSCEDIKPTVTAVNQQAISINAGSASGIKRGDEWLIADPRNFPTQLVGKEGAPQTLLATVQSVTSYDAKLILAAGPVNSVQVNWKAWPADTVVKNPSVTAVANQNQAKPAPTR